ncbi:MAG TPA: acetate--CoA ligase family protein [Gemmatimonadaceae bacterium]|nr:acetate--CoA ligase family protein [Gemmatimonadaceae bacterium]
MTTTAPIAPTATLAPAPAPTAVPGLDPILAPRSIAVIGASRAPNTIGHQLLRNLIHHGFTGAVYPVNPGARAICGVRAYPSIADVPERVDMAVIVVPKERVLGVAEECGRAGVRGIVVISAGFREVGGAGEERERALLEVVRRHGMRMVGPNCMGVLNAHPSVSMNATFAPIMPPSGGVAFVSQSGAMGVSVLDYARERGIGIAQFVSVGNKPDVSGNDLLLQWEHDPAVQVILMYVENFGNPRRFLEIARRITRRKPVIALKSGRSRVGARAASSHTGALAASDVAVDALLAQAGVLRATSFEELFDMAAAFGAPSLPRTRRAAVLTNAGGPGILAADAMETHGLELVELRPETVAALAPLFPEEASIRNPLDMIASANPAGYRAALERLLRDEGVDSVMAIFTPPFGVRTEEVAAAIADVAGAFPDKPVLAVLMGRDGLPEGRAALHARGIPSYLFPESAARALGALCRYREWRDRPDAAGEPLEVDRAGAAAILDGARRAGRDRLDEREALALLEAYGIPVAPARLARSAREAAELAEALGLPVAMKVVSPQVIHKTDAGGVRLGITDAEDARLAYRDIVESVTQAVPGATVDGVLVQRMVSGSRELIAGITREPFFGPLVMFGLGGVFVEALRDVTFRVAPITGLDAREMMAGLRGAAALRAFRGLPPVDEAAVADVLRRLAQLALDFPEIAELDANPLVALERGVLAVDARVRLAGA